MDLSMNCPSFAVLHPVGDKVEIVEVVHVKNKNNKKTNAQKLHEIASELKRIILDHCTGDIELSVVREKGFSRFAMTTQTLFRVVGVSDLMVFDLVGIKDIAEITPTSVKKFITGDGKASKDDVEQGVRKYLVDRQKTFKFATDDESDAVAVGISHMIQKGLFYK